MIPACYNRKTAVPIAAWRAGFTLVELLVATILLSTVLSSVYLLAHASLRAWSVTEGGFDVYREARSAFTLFGHEYNNMTARAGHLFEGDDRSITMFVIAQPMDLDEGEGRRLMQVRYSYNRNKRTLERSEALVQTALPKRPSDPKKFDRGRVKVGRAFKEVIAENVTRFKIRYIWVPAPENVKDDEAPRIIPPIYTDRHHNLWGLPQGVELTRTFRDPEDRKQTYTLKSTFPTRGGAHRMQKSALEKMIFEEN